MPEVADTGYLVGYWRRNDAYHTWARSLTVELPLRTCEAVLTEAAYILDDPSPLVRMILAGDLVVDFEFAAHISDLDRWLKKYADISPGLADACVVKMGELFPNDAILTTDRHDFTIYRTLAGKPLNCVFPDR